MKRVSLCVLTIILCLSYALAGSIEKSSAVYSFSLSIKEGFGSVAIGDMNTTLKSINSIYDAVKKNYPGRCTGEIVEIPNNYIDWEVELQWFIQSGFSIGIAVSGPTRFQSRSFLTYTIVDYAGTQTENNTYISKIRVSAPIKLNVYRKFTIFPKVNLSINGGLGYYRARLTQSFILEVRSPLDDRNIRIYDFDVSGRKIGFHCGAGLEWGINNRLYLLAGGQWNFSKITKFSGTDSVTQQSFDAQGQLIDSWSMIGEGILYHYIGEDEYLGKRREKLVVCNFFPEIGYDFPSDVRKAFLSLRGFTFRIGIRIGLF